MLSFIDDPATISDKQLLSPNRSTLCDAGAVQVFFRNNFNLQDGFDGGVLEVSFDGGQTFQDVLAAGATFVVGGYNGHHQQLLWQSAGWSAGMDR
jgi:hypothetical protein